MRFLPEDLDIRRAEGEPLPFPKTLEDKSCWVLGEKYFDDLYDTIGNEPGLLFWDISNEPGFRIGLVHANVGTQPYAAPVPLEELAAAPVDYWALGHMHRRKLLLSRPMTVYCGSIFRLEREENEWYAVNRITVSGSTIHRELLPLGTHN